MTALEIYNTLHNTMGKQIWLEDWQESPWEVVYGAILVQNTSWQNVAPSLMNLKDAINFDPQKLLSLSVTELQNLIRPSGFFTRKEQAMRNVVKWTQQYQFSITKIQAIPKQQLRMELLAIKGIGPETADYVMMYAFGQSGFIVDKYARRIFTWLGKDLPTKYDDAKRLVEQEAILDNQEWAEFHALIVNAGKQWKTMAEMQKEFK